MKDLVDLHLHTNASDGDLSSEGLVDLAISRGLKAMAITDHDTVDGIRTALDYSAKNDIEVIPGIEISCKEKERGFDEVHVLGLFIDSKNKSLLEMTQRIKQNRIEQKKQIIGKLNELGFDIDFSEVKDSVKFSFGRPHIAAVLLKNYPDRFDSIQDVFDQYLKVGKPAYIGIREITRIADAIKIIKESGGIPILAHPGVFRQEDSLELIDYFLGLGGKGIETYYPYDKVYSISPEDSNKRINFYNKVAKEKNLLVSGGSDYHGSIRPTDLGEIEIPYSVVEKLREASQS